MFEVEGKRWYASTLELQLASLELCRACRSVPTLHARVDDDTPRTLWSRRASSRVPVVTALCLTWALPTEGLQRVAIELYTRLEFLHRQGSSSAGNLESVVWPEGLKRLVLDIDSETSVGAVA